MEVKNMFGKNQIKKTIKIEGMHCEHCAKKVENALSELDNVKKAKVNLKKQEASIVLEKEIDNKVITEAIENIDFKVTDIL